jgi:hypothetical protein
MSVVVHRSVVPCERMALVSSPHKRFDPLPVHHFSRPGDLAILLSKFLKKTFLLIRSENFLTPSHLQDSDCGLQ